MGYRALHRLPCPRPNPLPNAATNRKLVKQKGQELTGRLQHMSRTKHRGGVFPNLREQAAAGAERPADGVRLRRAGASKVGGRRQ